jgi:hypothetical protein
VNAGSGAQGIKANSVMFAMFYKGDLLLRLPPARVQELVERGDGRPYDPGTGPMKDRVLVPYDEQSSWIPLAEESLEYVTEGSA